MAQVVDYAPRMGTMLMRTNALYLVAASTAAFLVDAIGIRMAGVGFVDAHELALVAGLLLWCASPRPCWHLAAAAVQALFAAANVAHWEAFVSADLVLAGWFTTAVHVLFAVLHSVTARTSAAASAGALTAAVESV